MTSRNSFFKLLKIRLKDHIWSIALSCVVFFFALGIYSVMQADSILRSYSNGAYAAEVLAGVYRRNVFGEGNTILLLSVIFVSIVIAINGFSYLFSKQKVDMYHSMPVKRTELFAANYAAGFLAFVVPYLVFDIVACIIGKSFGILDIIGIKTMFVMLGINVLGFLGIYTAITIAMLLVGKLPVALIASGIMLVYIPSVILIIEMAMERFFITYSYQTGNELNSLWLYRLSPIGGYVYLEEGIMSFMNIFDLSVRSFVLYILYILIAVTVALLLFCNRKSEAAGNSIAFKKTMPYFSVLLLVPAALTGGMLFDGIIGQDSGMNYGWMIFGAVITIILGHFVIQAIYYSDFRSLFKNLWNPLAAAIITALIGGIFICDVFGYDSYIPDEKNFTGAAVADSLNPMQEYFNFDAYADEYGTRNIWVNSDEYRLEHMNVTDYQVIKELAVTATSDTVKYKQAERSGNTDIYNEPYAYITVRYNENGRRIFRTYNLNVVEHLDLYNKLFSNKEYKEGIFDILTLSDEDMTDIRFADTLGDEVKGLSAEQTGELIDTYRKEFLAMDAYGPADTYPIGYIYKNVNVKDTNYFGDYVTNKGYVYPGFTETIALLKEYGYNPEEYHTADNIENINVCNYHYNEEDGEEPDNALYTDREDIERIYEALIPMESYDPVAIFHAKEELEVTVFFKEIPAQNEGTFYKQRTYYFPKGSVPEFVSEDVNYYDE